MQRTLAYVFMDWAAIITNLNSSDTGCRDYETVIVCLTCDKKKELCIPPVNHQLARVSIQVIHTELYAGRGEVFREAEYRFEGSFILHTL